MKANTTSCAHLSPQICTACVAWCGVGHEELNSAAAHQHSHTDTVVTMMISLIHEVDFTSEVTSQPHTQFDLLYFHSITVVYKKYLKINTCMHARAHTQTHTHTHTHIYSTTHLGTHMHTHTHTHTHTYTHTHTHRHTHKQRSSHLR